MASWVKSGKRCLVRETGRKTGQRPWVARLARRGDLRRGYRTRCRRPPPRGGRRSTRRVEVSDLWTLRGGRPPLRVSPRTEAIMKIRTYLAAAGLLWLGACSPSGAETGHEAHDNAPMSAVRSELLVSTAWLADHLDDPGVVVLHVAPDRSGYNRGHIPGARFLPLGAIVVE